MPWNGLPDGTFVIDADGTPLLVQGALLVEWSSEGYGTRRRRPRRGSATVITPPSSVGVLRAGYAVQVDPSTLG